MSTTNTTTLKLSYLDDSRTERSEEIEVDATELARLANAGRRIVSDRGEFSADEIEGMDVVQLARLAASAERGSEAYSLACSSYLA